MAEIQVPDLDKTLFRRDGTYAPYENHKLDSLLDEAIRDFEAAALRFSLDAISDEKVRVSYNNNIQRISKEVRATVDRGEMTPRAGSEFCSELRNKILREHRAITSPQGVAYARNLKPDTGVDYETLLNEKTLSLYKDGKVSSNKFELLSEADKNKVYYKIINSGGQGRASVNIGTKVLRSMGKVCIIVTATWATYAILTAENKTKETIRQGAIIGGGFAGGTVAGVLFVSVFCGPAAWVCAIAIVLLGSVVGGMLGEAAVDYFDEEVEEFSKWVTG